MRTRIATAFSLVLICLGVAACGSDSSGPLGPETLNPPVEPPITSVNVDLLERLLHDLRSVEGLSRMLLDQVRAEGMREQANVLHLDLGDENFVTFAGLLAGLTQLCVDYVDDPGFDPHDLPVISALQLYVSESEVALEGDGNWIIDVEKVSE